MVERQRTVDHLLLDDDHPVGAVVAQLVIRVEGSVLVDDALDAVVEVGAGLQQVRVDLTELAAVRADAVVRVAEALIAAALSPAFAFQL